jgi:tetratricopeptide (TPR) repeat protein
MLQPPMDQFLSFSEASILARKGELDLAQQLLDTASRRDSSEPSLWFARSLLQQAQGNSQMALASVNYALAIWNEANPDYIDYRAAVVLRDDLMAFPGWGGQSTF